MGPEGRRSASGESGGSRHAGLDLLRHDKHKAAVPHLQNSLKLLDRPVAHFHLAAALAKAGSAKEAREQFDIALRQDPN